MKRFYFFIYLVFVFSCGLVAQNQPDNPQVEETITPYEITNISSAIQLTDDQVRAALEIGNDSTSITKAQESLTALISAYRDLEEDTVILDFTSLSLWGLKDINQQWLNIKESLLEFNLSIDEPLKEIAGHKEILEEFIKKWTATKQFADTADVSSEIKESIGHGLEATKKANQKLKEKQEAYLLIENNVSKELLLINGILNQISDTRIERSKDVFIPDSPPLFQVVRHSENIDFFSLLFQSVKESVKEVKDFLAKKPIDIIAHIFFFLLLWFILFLVKRDLFKSGFDKDEAYTVTARILSAPFTNALLINIVFSGLFYENFPLILRVFLVLVALVPVIILLPRVIDQKNKGFIYFVAALVVLDKFQSQLTFDVLSQRIAVLALSLFGIIGLILFSLPKSEFYKNVVSHKRKWILHFLKLFILVLVIATYGNINGNFQLSLLLTSGVVHAFTVGVVVFIAINIIRAMLLYVIRSGLSGKLNLLIKFNKQIEYWSFLLVSMVGFFFWFKSSLRGFALLSPVVNILNNINNASWQFGEIVLSVSNIVDFIVILFVFIVIANILHVVLREEVLTRFDLRKGIPLALAILSRYIVLFIGFVLAMSAAGISLSKLSLLVGALGVGIGFGLQSIVSNFVSGLVIIFERPIHIGDTISAGNLEGEVKEIGLRSSIVRSWEGAEVIVPNNDLISKQVTNWTLSDKRRRVERIVLIESGPSPRKVKTVIDNVLKDHKGLLKEPAPMSYFLGFENNALKFRVLIWISEGLLNTPSEVLLNLHDALTVNGYKAYMPIQKVIVDKQENNESANHVIGLTQDKNPNDQ